MPQEEQKVTYEEAKAIVKEKQKRRWLQQHPYFNSKDDFYYLLPREVPSNNCEAKDWTLQTQTSHVL